MRRFFPVLALLAIISPVAAQIDTIRVCSYNVLDFGADVTQRRRTHMRRVLAEIRPHILVTREIVGREGYSNFRGPLGIVPEMVAAPFNDGPDTDNAMFCDGSRFNYYEHQTFSTEHRDLDFWTLVLRSTGDTLVVIAAHLKEGDSKEDELARRAEAILLRDRIQALPLHYHYILAGGLHTTSSSDSAYTLLTRRFPASLYDPIVSPGDWHDAPAFAAIHTESSRTRAFEGGNTGGLDDRFDFILVSGSLFHFKHLAQFDAVLPLSYHAFGNDGQHLNDSINAKPNGAVSAELADALHYASDHLPVVVDLRFVGLPAAVETRPNLPRELDLTAVPDDGKVAWAVHCSGDK